LKDSLEIITLGSIKDFKNVVKNKFFEILFFPLFIKILQAKNNLKDRYTLLQISTQIWYDISIWR